MCDIMQYTQCRVPRLYSVSVVLYGRRTSPWSDFYRAMHYSAKCGIATACRLSVCDVGVSGP